MTKRKECVEIDQAQLFQQFNLQADRDRHDLIFDVVEDIAKNRRPRGNVIFENRLGQFARQFG